MNNTSMNNLNVTIPWPGWKAVRHIGSGSYGKVYEIERENYGEKEKAALKVMTIPQERGDIEEKYASGYDEASVRGFYKQYLEKIKTEYSLMKTLKGSSNIVYCEDYCEVEHEGEIGWDIYLRMELLEPLSKLLLKRALSEKEVIKLGKDICRALKVCEAENIVHRDIKPGNILLSKYGDFKLGDFGVARTLDHTTHATKAGAELYMAPEVIKREAYGKEVDIYSLGLVMYTLLNKGRMPYLPIDRAATLEEVDDAFDRRVRPAEKSQFRLPAPAYGSDALKRIVLKACEYRKEDRYQKADDMLADLENLDLKRLNDEPLYLVEIKSYEDKEPEPSKPEDSPSPPEEESEPVGLNDLPTEGNNWAGDQKTDDVLPDGTGDAPDGPPTEGAGFKPSSEPIREDEPVSPKEQPEQSHPDLGPQSDQDKKKKKRNISIKESIGKIWKSETRGWYVLILVLIVICIVTWYAKNSKYHVADGDSLEGINQEETVNEELNTEHTIADFGSEVYDGRTFNAFIKYLAGHDPTEADGVPVSDDIINENKDLWAIHDTYITAIKQSETEPIGANRNQIFVNENPDNPVYLWYEDGCIYYYCAAEKIILPESTNLMFSECESLTELDISRFDTSRVTNMCSMFDNCISLKQLDLSNFDTSSTTIMDVMFYRCESLIKLNISSFDTSSVTGMNTMFDGCSSLTELDISNFDTSSVTDLAFMFQGCSSLKVDCSSWDVGNVETHKQFSEGAEGVIEPEWIN